MERFLKNSLIEQFKGYTIDPFTQNGIVEPILFDEKSMENSPFVNMGLVADIKKEEVKVSGGTKIMNRRLNDFDGNILQDYAFVNIEDTELKDEEKIHKIRKLIEANEAKTDVLVDFKGSDVKQQLKDENTRLKEAITVIQANSPSFRGKMVNSASNLLDKFTESSFVKAYGIAVSDFLGKFFPDIQKGVLMKKAVGKLKFLNETAKGLVHEGIPYGESNARYNELIACLSSANTIHAKLTKKF